MSDIMLHGVLRMPPEMWDNGVIDIAQRHSRYLQASDRIAELESELESLKRERTMLVDKLADTVKLLDDFEYEYDEDSSAGAAFFEARISADWFFHVKHSSEKILSATEPQATQWLAVHDAELLAKHSCWSCGAMQDRKAAEICNCANVTPSYPLYRENFHIDGCQLAAASKRKEQV